jgi:hypothetical protein
MPTGAEDLGGMVGPPPGIWETVPRNARRIMEEAVTSNGSCVKTAR